MTPDSEGNLFWRRPQGHSREPCFPSLLGFPARSRGRAQWTVKGFCQRSCPEKQRAFAEDDVLRGRAPDEAWRSTGQEEDSFQMQTQESCSQNPGVTSHRCVIYKLHVGNLVRRSPEFAATQRPSQTQQTQFPTGRAVLHPVPGEFSWIKINVESHGKKITKRFEN